MWSVWCKGTRNAPEMGVLRCLKYSVPEGLKFNTYLAQKCRHEHVAPCQKRILVVFMQGIYSHVRIMFYGLHPLNINRWVYTETFVYS